MLEPDLNQQIRFVGCLLTFARITQRIGHHTAALAAVIVGTVQMTVQPELCHRQQVVERITEARRAGA